MLAVSEDATAAQLMGIRPQRMQALAWAMAGAATGIAGALIANFFYTSPTVGETLAILAFVTVSFGGFGSVLGALVAGLIIGVVESLKNEFKFPIMPNDYTIPAGHQFGYSLASRRAGTQYPDPHQAAVAIRDDIRGEGLRMIETFGSLCESTTPIKMILIYPSAGEPNT
jgi:hypothetical protein